MSFFT